MKRCAHTVFGAQSPCWPQNRQPSVRNVPDFQRHPQPLAKASPFAQLRDSEPVAGVSKGLETMDDKTLARFMAKVRVNAETGCWEWTASRRSTYGAFLCGYNGYSHRFSYMHFVGPIPFGLQLDHLCRNHICCNPAHLEAVTHRENLRRGNGISAQCLRKTHCDYGHSLDDAYICKTKYGTQRKCRLCSARKCAAYRLKRAEGVSVMSVVDAGVEALIAESLRVETCGKWGVK